MAKVYLKQLLVGLAIAVLLSAGVSCNVVSSTGEFYGSTKPPQSNILRYVNGDEPESLDPPVSAGQPEARIYLALYQGLVEYDPKTLNPIPALAERWDVNNDSSEFAFHLRRNARWSNGDPITAQDFVYSIRRGLSPGLASKNAYLAYAMAYAEAYNQKAVFARDKQTKQFLLEKDVADNASPATAALSQQPISSFGSEYNAGSVGPVADPDQRPDPGSDTVAGEEPQAAGCRRGKRIRAGERRRYRR